MKRYYLLLLSGLLLIIISCNKQDEWLDKKTNKTDVILSKLSDYQSLLDGDDLYMNSRYPYLGQLGADEYYVTNSIWQAGLVTSRNCYIWASDIFAGGVSNDWNSSYSSIEYSNICIDGLKKIERTAENGTAWDNVIGSSLFFRGRALFSLAELYAPQYDIATAAKDAGLPIRTSSDINVRSERASVEATYQQIISDLETAEKLLPAVPMFKTRPCKAAASGLLARVYLSMGNYTNANTCAERTLAASSNLIDYNTLSSSASYPIPDFKTGNKEVIFHGIVIIGDISIQNGLIDTLLYNSYNVNDLRKTLFFKSISGGYNFRGQYTGGLGPFGGISTNEIYLIRAECQARANNITAAMNDLNTLLIKRWKTGTFIPFSASSGLDALTKVLNERRKELIFYCSNRWSDLRRLNKDPQFARTLTRIINGQTYVLPPNDPKYVYPIPDDEIRGSGIAQNPR